MIRHPRNLGLRHCMGITWDYLGPFAAVVLFFLQLALDVEASGTSAKS